MVRFSQEIRATVGSRIASGKFCSVRECLEFAELALPQIDDEAQEDLQLIDALGTQAT